MKRTLYYLISILIVLYFNSCNRKTNTDNIAEDNLSHKKIDSLYIYFKNGKIKEKGKIDNKNRIGWWFSYDSYGNLIQKTEYIIRHNDNFLNQKIVFENGKINYNLSSFFELKLEDTLTQGKNVGEIKYYSNSKNYDLQYIYIIIENEYDGKIKKDTFTDDINKLWFGVNAYKKGDLKVKGIIEEELTYVKKVKDSAILTIKKHYKYFEKKVYVK